jgi:hypothetical protein
MKRRRYSSDETVSLFPFLAVLLCTMGTLALIFAIAAQNVAPEGTNADASVAERAETPNAVDAEYAAALAQTGDAPLEELEAEAESLAWFLEELNGVKTRTQAALERERERLAAAEKSLAKLRSEATVAKKRFETLRAETIADAAEDALALQEKIDALDAESNGSKRKRKNFARKTPTRNALTRSFLIKEKRAFSAVRFTSSATKRAFFSNRRAFRSSRPTSFWRAIQATRSTRACERRRVVSSNLAEQKPPTVKRSSLTRS